jgi:hypothetical protein
MIALFERLCRESTYITLLIAGIMVNAALKENLRIWVDQLSKDYLPIRSPTSIRNRNKSRFWTKSQPFSTEDGADPNAQM